jgi:hypothetical protein
MWPMVLRRTWHGARCDSKEAEEEEDIADTPSPWPSSWLEHSDWLTLQHRYRAPMAKPGTYRVRFNQDRRYVHATLHLPSTPLALTASVSDPVGASVQLGCYRHVDRLPRVPLRLANMLLRVHGRRCGVRPCRLHPGLGFAVELRNRVLGGGPCVPYELMPARR